MAETKTSSEKPVIVWFRRDLRLSDNPALNWAVKSGKPVIALYIYETDLSRERRAARAIGGCIIV